MNIVQIISHDGMLLGLTSGGIVIYFNVSIGKWKTWLGNEDFKIEVTI